MNNIECAKNKLIEAMESVDIYINTNSQLEDIDIRNFINNSLQFIALIVAIEQKFQIEIPDEMLVLDSFQSFNDLLEKIVVLSNETIVE